MRICILAPRVPPTPCGVGDHTLFLAKALVGLGATVEVWTSTNQQEHTEDGLTVLPVVADWHAKGSAGLVRALLQRRPGRVVLQWVPSLYDPRGINLSVPSAMGALALSGVEVDTVVHEAWVGFNRWQHFVSGPLQRAELGALALSSRKLLVSTGSWANQLRRWFPWKAGTISWVPVGSNIPVVPAQPVRERESRGLGAGGPVIVVFSPLGSGKGLELIEEGWRRAHHRWPNAHLVIMGAERNAVEVALPLVQHDARVIVTGYLPPAEVSRWMHCLDVLLAPFTDGLSGRRASAIAALDHGVPVVSTRGHLYDAQLFDHSPVVVTDYDRDGFAATVEDLLAAPARMERLAVASRKFALENFAWSRTAEAILGQ